MIFKWYYSWTSQTVVTRIWLSLVLIKAHNILIRFEKKVNLYAIYINISIIMNGLAIKNPNFKELN